jgi:hypothetical protein
MKRKTIYALMLVCCMALMSSANQSNKEGGKASLCASDKESTCCQKAGLHSKANIEADGASVPLNLFLFEL